jgi:hypothetical protein
MVYKRCLHGKDRAHGKDQSHGNEQDARQSLGAQQRSSTHVSVRPHGKDKGSRQSSGRTATSLPCKIRDAHGNDVVAVRLFAVWSLSCDYAWQSLCRVNRGLCGVICRMAMSCFPVVCVTFERLSKFWTTNVQKNFCFVTVYICPLGLLTVPGQVARSIYSSCHD